MSSLQIFSVEAPRYWALQIPVIPLRIMDKMPFISRWERYALTMPTPEEQKSWANLYGPNNIGLPLGPQSKMVAIDYDYTGEHSDKVLAAIMTVLKQSPWERIGKKGKVMMYRYGGHKSAKIHDEHGKTVVEILSEGNQVVLPPSIHPETNQPYVSNTHLCDVYDQLPELPNPDDLEDQLRLAIGQVIKLKDKSSGRAGKFKGIDPVPQGARDVSMTRYAGVLANEILRSNITLMQAFSNMRSWFDEKVQKVEGDQLDINKGYQQIVNFLLSDVQKGKTLPTGWDENLTSELREAFNLNFDDEQEEWPVLKLLEYIEAANAHGPNSVERQNAIQFVLRKLSKSVNLTSLQKDQVVQALRSDTKLPVAAFKRQLKEMEAGPIEGISHMEIAEAAIKDLTVKNGEMAFWAKELWVWEGAHWGKMDDQIIRKYVQQEFGSLPLAKRYSDHKQIVEVVKDTVPQKIKAEGLVQGINFTNGFLNRDLVLLPHSPEYGMTYTLEFGYRPEKAGKCPKFFKFLQDSWGGDPDYEDKVQALREAMATTLFGAATSFQRAFLLYGVPNTGKSVLINIISAMVPDDTRSASPPNKWDADFIAAQFTGVLLNVCGELDEKKKINGKLFKEIIDGSEITTRAIYGAPFEFRPMAAHWFSSNYLPKTPDTSGGFNRRWLILEFKRVIEEKDIIRELGSQIVHEEIEAIVAWAVEAWLPLVLRNNYTLPASHWDRIDEMEAANSNIRQWMKTNLVQDPESVLPWDVVYRNYWNHCTLELHVKNLDASQFRIEFNQFIAEKRMGEVFKDEKGRTFYRGFAINQEAKKGK